MSTEYPKCTTCKWHKRQFAAFLTGIDHICTYQACLVTDVVTGKEKLTNYVPCDEARDFTEGGHCGKEAKHWEPRMPSRF